MTNVAEPRPSEPDRTNAEHKRRDEWTPERRKAHGELTKSKMADPAVWKRISERTKEGMRPARPVISRTRADVVKLCAAWDEASSQARKAFVRKILAAVGSVSLVEPRAYLPAIVVDELKKPPAGLDRDGRVFRFHAGSGGSPPLDIEQFQLWCSARADLVEACLMDFHEAIDGSLAIAMQHGLTRAIGMDNVQTIIGRAFHKVCYDIVRAQT
jgi:hypothetical protein